MSATVSRTVTPISSSIIQSLFCQGYASSVMTWSHVQSSAYLVMSGLRPIPLVGHIRPRQIYGVYINTCSLSCDPFLALPLIFKQRLACMWFLSWLLLAVPYNLWAGNHHDSIIFLLLSFHLTLYLSIMPLLCFLYLLAYSCSNWHLCLSISKRLDVPIKSMT